MFPISCAKPISPLNLCLAYDPGFYVWPSSFYHWDRPPSKYLEKYLYVKSTCTVYVYHTYLYPNQGTKAGFTHRLFLWGDICASGKTSSPEAPLPLASPSHQDHACAAATENRMLSAALISSKLPLYFPFSHPSQTSRKKLYPFSHILLCSQNTSLPN